MGNDWEEALQASLFEMVLPLVIAAYCAMVEEEITAICGERDKYLSER